jgi:hypothetical protein
MHGADRADAGARDGEPGGEEEARGRTSGLLLHRREADALERTEGQASHKDGVLVHGESPFLQQADRRCVVGGD